MLNFNLLPSAAFRWLKDRDSIRALRLRRTRKLATRLGRMSKVYKITRREEALQTRKT
jgi:hypothetical protein